MNFLTIIINNEIDLTFYHRINPHNLFIILNMYLKNINNTNLYNHFLNKKYNNIHI
jgi:hypothetical protein